MAFACQFARGAIPAEVALEIKRSDVVLYSRDNATFRIICKADKDKIILRSAEAMAATRRAGCLIFVNRRVDGNLQIMSYTINENQIKIAGKTVPVSDIITHCGVDPKELVLDIGAK